MLLKLLTFIALFGLTSASTMAQGIVPQPQTDDLEFLKAAKDVIYMNSDESQVIKLDKDAASVIVANPDHVSVLIETPRVLIAIPQQPGATSLSVLDSLGNIIEKRHIVVGAPKKKYLRIRRACNNAPDTMPCTPTSTYFCPNGCHQVNVIQPENAQAPSSAETAAQINSRVIDDTEGQ